MTPGKTIGLTRRTFVGKVMSLLFNLLSRLVITFLPRSKCLLISWLQSPYSVILEPKKVKSATVSTVSPSISHEVMGPDAMILVFWMFSLSLKTIGLFASHLTFLGCSFFIKERNKSTVFETLCKARVLWSSALCEHLVDSICSFFSQRIIFFLNIRVIYSPYRKYGK